MSITTLTGKFEKVIALTTPLGSIGGFALGQSVSYRYVLEGNKGYPYGLLQIFTGVTARSTFDLKSAANLPAVQYPSSHANGLTYYDGKLYACIISHHICRMALSSDGTSITAGAWYETSPNTGEVDEIGSIAHLYGDYFLVRHHGCNFGVYHFQNNKYVEISNSGSMEIDGLRDYFDDYWPGSYTEDGKLKLTMNDIDYQAVNSWQGFLYLTFWDGVQEDAETCNGIIKVSVKFDEDYKFLSMQAVEATRFSIADDETTGDKDLKKLEVEGIDYSYATVYFAANGDTVVGTDMDELLRDDSDLARAGENRDGVYKFVRYETVALQ